MSAENNIFIKNVHKDVTEKEFEELFAQFGQVFSSKISYDENGQSRCYGYFIIFPINPTILNSTKSHNKFVNYFSVMYNLRIKKGPKNACPQINL